MKALIQRVSSARVTVKGVETGHISAGLLIFLGIGRADTVQDIELLAEKILNLRVFSAENGKLAHSVLDSTGEVLVVSQFTLYADCTHGGRPDFSAAAASEVAKDLYNEFVQHMKKSGLKTATGHFGAMMEVELTNDGPVTLLLESEML